MENAGANRGATPSTSLLEATRIIHVVRQFHPMIGGLEDVVLNLAKCQLGRFASVEVVTLDRLFTEPDKLLPSEDEVEGIKVRRIPFKGSKRYPLAPGVLPKIGDVDLVHIHAIDFFFDFLAATRIIHRKPLVATTHGGFFHTAQNAGLKKVWFNTVTKASTTQYRGIACCGGSDYELFQPLAGERAHLIENGVALEKFWSASSVSPVRRLVTVGRFSQNKRLDRVLNVLKALHEGNAEWQLDIIGSPSDLSEEDLEKEITSRGLKECVHLHIGISNEAVREVFSNCSLFISGSDYEGFGLVLIEAMSAGLIPVVHENAAFQSLSEKHPLVQLTDFENTAQAAGAVQSAFAQLSDNKGQRNSAMQSSKLHGWETAAGHYEEFYKAALKR